MAGSGTWGSAEPPFDMDEDPSATADAANNAMEMEDFSRVHQQLQDLLTATELQQVELQVRGAKAQLRDLGDFEGLGRMLSACVSGPVVLRRGEGSRAAGECLRSLRHSFFILRLPSEDDYTIMDPYFREQFSLHQPTARYSALLNLLPEEFAGRPSAVRSIVELLGREIQLACNTKGTSLPPWRATKSMLSKWFPCRYQDSSYRHGSQQQLPAAAKEGGRSSSVPARPVRTVLGFSAPCIGCPSEQQKRTGSLDLPVSALGTVSGPKRNQTPASTKPQLWQIRTVKLGQYQAPLKDAPQSSMGGIAYGRQNERPAQHT